jgi:hypothetical protein
MTVSKEMELVVFWAPFVVRWWWLNAKGRRGFRRGQPFF